MPVVVLVEFFFRREVEVAGLCDRGGSTAFEQLDHFELKTKTVFAHFDRFAWANQIRRFDGDAINTHLTRFTGFYRNGARFKNAHTP